MKSTLVIFGGIFLLAFSDALTVGRFDPLAPGVWNAWNNTDPSNVRQGAFGMQCGNNKLWLVSRRLYRTGFSDPWDPASRGGIVSTLNLRTVNWTHKSYDRLDEDRYGDKLFSLNGRLFMLTYGTDQKKIAYHKLFFWNDNTQTWLETPFDIDPAASTVSTNSISQLAVHVPDQSGKIAYCVASSLRMAQSGSEMVYSKLEVEFRGNVPIKATLKPIARERSANPSAVVFTAVKGNVLYGFVQQCLSDGCNAEYNYVYVVDLKTKSMSNVSLTGAQPPMDFNGERMFQTRDEIFIVGGTQMIGLGRFRDVRDIWSLNLNTKQWKATNGSIPENAGTNAAFDQKNKKLYFAGLKEGVRVAQVSTS